MDLSIIYVNWNSVDYLRESIASVLEHTRNISFEIIVVDNASPQPGVDELKSINPCVVVIKSDKNLGFAGANNYGFQHCKGDYVLFLNPDTRLINPAINIMQERMQNRPNPGVVGCKLLNSDRSVQITSIQKLPTILNQVLDLEYLQMRWPRCRLWDIGPLFSEDLAVQRVEVISGACMFMTREAFRKIGGFSEDYFMYAEDIDLNYKSSHAGLINYYVPEAQIVHYGGGSSSRQKVRYWPIIMKYRAMGQLFGKMGGPAYAWSYRTAIGTAAVIRLLILAIAYPFGNMLGKKQTLRETMRKWNVILRWAIGIQTLALQD